MAAAFPDHSRAGIQGCRMTADEYLALGETPWRAELVHGVVLASPGPHPGDEPSRHGLLMSADEFLSLGPTRVRYELIDSLVVGWREEAPPHGAIVDALAELIAGGDTERTGRTTRHAYLRTSPATVLRPDLSVYHRSRALATVEPPALAIEVSSPESAACDRTTKLQDYDRFGVGEYWVVDPDTLVVRVWTRQGARLVGGSPTRGVVQSAAIPGLLIDFDAVRRIVERRR